MKKQKRHVKRAKDYSPQARIFAGAIPEPNSGCWIWDGALDSWNYGSVKYGNRMWKAHRLSFEAFKGPINELKVLHHCDVPQCVNPDHLFLGTDLDNTRDMIAKGRQRYTTGTSHPLAKLNEKQINEIRQSTQTRTKLAIKFGVSYQLIWRVQKGKVWKHLLPGVTP